VIDHFAVLLFVFGDTHGFLPVYFLPIILAVMVRFLLVLA
jgi:hypothetical protein